MTFSMNLTRNKITAFSKYYWTDTRGSGIMELQCDVNSTTPYYSPGPSQSSTSEFWMIRTIKTMPIYCFHLTWIGRQQSRYLSPCHWISGCPLRLYETNLFFVPFPLAAIVGIWSIFMRFGSRAIHEIRGLIIPGARQNQEVCCIISVSRASILVE